MAKQERIEQAAVCREIGARTGGDILIGVVGPVALATAVVTGIEFPSGNRAAHARPRRAALLTERETEVLTLVGRGAAGRGG